MTLPSNGSMHIVDRQSKIQSYLLTFGGFLGMGDKWFAIPTGALTLPADGKNFILAVDKDRLKTAPGFEKDRWPSMGDSTWSMGVNEYYGVKPYWLSEGEG